MSVEIPSKEQIQYCFELVDDWYVLCAVTDETIGTRQSFLEIAEFVNVCLGDGENVSHPTGVSMKSFYDTLAGFAWLMFDDLRPDWAADRAPDKDRDPLALAAKVKPVYDYVFMLAEKERARQMDCKN